MKRIFLIDCPGIVPPLSKDTESDILFRGVVRVEHVSNPEQYIPDMLQNVKENILREPMKSKVGVNLRKMKVYWKELVQNL